jgi:hypothetical protein
MAHHPKSVLSPLFGRSTGEVLAPPGSLLRGVATTTPIGSIEAKMPAAAGGGLPTPDFSGHRAPTPRILADRVVESHQERRPEAPVSWSQSLHTFLHTENAVIES